MYIIVHAHLLQIFLFFFFQNVCTPFFFSSTQCLSLRKQRILFSLLPPWLSGEHPRDARCDHGKGSKNPIDERTSGHVPPLNREGEQGGGASRPNRPRKGCGCLSDTVCGTQGRFGRRGGLNVQEDDVWKGSLAG